MAGEDASLDAAVSKIMSMGSEAWTQDTAKLDRLERSEAEIDVNNADGTTDLEQLEREERSGGDENAEAGEASEAGGEEAPVFLEIPRGEGEEAEKVPLADAVEAVKSWRQLQGDIATAVTKAEEEAYQKHDAVTGQLTEALSAIRNEARVAIEMMRAYEPQPPDPIMLDRNSGYYDPEQYHLARIQYERAMGHRAQLETRLRQAEEGLKTTGQFQDQEFVRREQEKAARFIPEWKDEKTRAAKKAEILDVLSKRYGVTQADLDDIVDHKAWRMMADLVKMANVETKAPEIKKAVQEKAPKLVNGRVPPKDPSNGRFVSEARKELQAKGTEDAFVNYLLKAGASQRRR